MRLYKIKFVVPDKFDRKVFEISVQNIKLFVDESANSITDEGKETETEGGRRL